tara:strand:+ start:11350 stop:12087 length:738 start_codon:yes stop_codon:yes gene_type:complete
MKYFLGDLKYYFNKIITSSYKTENLSELRKNGILVINEFISAEICEFLRNSIDKSLDNDLYSWKDDLGSDYRIFGFENLEPRSISLFEPLEKLYKGYIDFSVNNSFLMANRVRYKKNNIGSGGGWHRDSLNRRQLKFMVYLNDVSSLNGAFEYLPRTHSARNKFLTNKFLTKKVRYSQSEIEEYQQECPSKVFTGQKGTCIVFDSSGLHRGTPIKNGERYAITKYMYDSNIPRHVSSLIISGDSN